MKKHAAIEALETRIAPAVLFAVEVGTNKLVSFDSAAPGTLLTDVAITGLDAGEVVSGIDSDPTTGRLLALGIKDDGSTRTATVYEINPVTGAATSSGFFGKAGLADTGTYGFEINPLTGVAHIVNDLDGNDTLFSGGIGSGGTLSDPTREETITAIAFDRPFGGTGTTMYGYNFATDELVTVGDKDGEPQDSTTGVVKSIARAKLGGVNFIARNSAAVGFDIGGTIGGPEMGWIALDNTNSKMRLYNIDLASAELTDLGTIGDGTRVFSGLTVQTEAPAPTISDDGKTATWRDLDGDNVTLKLTKGTLTAANFRMLQGANETSVLSNLTLTDAAFTGTNVILTAKPGTSGGDGRVSIGAISALDVDLGIVTIPGDLVTISAGDGNAPAPSVKFLTAASIGEFGKWALPSSTVPISLFTDAVGKITIGGDFYGTFNLGTGKVGSITIGGDIIGGTEAGRGSIAANSGSTLGKFTLKGSLRTVNATAFGSVSLFGVGSVFIGGDIIGGDAINSGQINIAGTSKTLVSVLGDIIGGAGQGSGKINFSGGGSIKVGGSLIGGDSFGTGNITALGTTSIAIKGSIIGGKSFGSGGILGGTLKSLTVGGGIVSTGQDMFISATRIGTLKVGGDVAGLGDGNITIGVGGIATPTTAAESNAIGKFTIGGDLRGTIVAAGITTSFTAVTPDAVIGPVKIGGNMEASSISAGITPVNFIFGDVDDAFATGNTGSAAIIAKIASITIGGQLLGTVGGAADSFGIIAEQIGALTIGKVKVPLTAAKDDLTLGFTSDVRVREL